MEKLIVAMDHGFRSVKVGVGNNFVKYDTILSEAEPTNIDLDYKSDTILYQGKEYLVGEEAMREVNSIYARDVEYILKYAPLFTHYALRKIATSYGITHEQIKALSVGLPLRDYQKNKNAMQMALSNFEVAGVEYKFDNIIVNAQGLGGFADLLVRKPPQDNEEGYIFDIGENTVILVRYVDGKAVRNGSEQLDRRGISQVVEDLNPVIESKLGRSLSLGELRRLITGEGIMHRGVRHKFEEEVNAAVSNYVIKLLERVFDKHKERFDRCARITLIGGGAYYIAKHIPPEYQYLIEVAKHPEFANVRGYAYVAYREMKKGLI